MHTDTSGRWFVAVSAVAILGVSGSAYGEGANDPGRENTGQLQQSESQRIQKLEEAVRQLQEQNEALQKKVGELERDKMVAKPDQSVAAQSSSNLPPARADNEVRLFWKDGLVLESADKKTFKGKIGGRVQLDAAAFSEDKNVESLVGDIPSAGEFRRVRLSTEGEFARSQPAFYKLELDFAHAEVAFKDVYLGLRDIPYVGKVQAGHFKEPVSLELLTSANFISFMERAAPVEAFAPERNTGVMIGNAAFDERMTWALGGFSESGDGGDFSLDSGQQVAARLTGLPWWDEQAKGARLLHVGVSGDFVNPADGMARFRTRPEAHLAPRFVDTGTFAADNAYLMATEAALVLGPFSLQGEYFQQWVERPGLSTALFDGFYVFGSWFLTGEHRAYKRSAAAFDRVHPKRNFGLGADGGLGAWELLLRYSHVDLNDSGVAGGRLDDITAGINWYLNPNMKLMFNYVNAEVNRSGLDGTAHVFETRYQFDF